jgi:hypothetical protein
MRKHMAELRGSTPYMADLATFRRMTTHGCCASLNLRSPHVVHLTLVMLSHSTWQH